MSVQKENLHVLYISFKGEKKSLLHILFVNHRITLTIKESEQTWKDGKLLCFEDAREEDQHVANVQ